MVNKFKNLVLSLLYDVECLDVVDTPEQGVLQRKKCKAVKKLIN